MTTKVVIMQQRLKLLTHQFCRIKNSVLSDKYKIFKVRSAYRSKQTVRFDNVWAM